MLRIREVIISKLIQRQAVRRSLWDSSAVQANSIIVRNIRPRPLPSIYSTKLKEGWMDPSRGLEILRRENLLPPPRIEHRFLGCPVFSLVTTANDPPPTTLICKCKNLTHALHDGAWRNVGIAPLLLHPGTRQKRGQRHISVVLLPEKSADIH